MMLQDDVKVLSKIHTPSPNIEYYIGLDISIINKEEVITFCVLNRNTTLLIATGHITNTNKIPGEVFLSHWYDLISRYYNNCQILIDR